MRKFLLLLLLVVGVGWSQAGMTKTPINKDMTSVRVDGVHKYYELGTDINYANGSNLYQSDTTVSISNLSDSIDYTVSTSKIKTRFGANNKWNLVIQNRTGDTSRYRFRFYGLVGATIKADTISSYVILDTMTGAQSWLNERRVEVIPNKLILKFIPTFSGIDVRHRFKSKRILAQNDGYDAYGAMWVAEDTNGIKYLVNDMGKTRITKGFGGGGRRFIEWFTCDQMFVKNITTGQVTDTVDVVNNYTTVSTGLTANTVLAAGTYFLTANINTGNFDLTFDGSAGSPVIKSMGFGFIHDGTGYLKTINTDSTHKLIFTSRNDNTKGEIITGSTGTPASIDRPYTDVNSTGSGSDSLAWVESWYGTGSSLLTSHTIASTTKIFKLDNFKLKFWNNNTGGVASPFTGCTNSCFGIKIKQYIFSNFNIDSTNRLSGTGALAFWIGNSDSTQEVYNGYIYALNSVNVRTIYFESAGGKSFVTNVIVSGSGPSVMQAGRAGTDTLEVRNCVLSSKGALNGYAIGSYNLGATMRIIARDNIIYNCTGTGAIGIKSLNGVVTINENFNNFWNNTTNSSVALGANSKTVDPFFVKLPSAAQRSISSVMADSFVVGNLALKKHGSQKFSQAAIDTSLYSFDGYRALQSDTVTPGIYYRLSTFAVLGPSITAQPIPDTANDFSPASFTVVATGTAPITYQWAKNTAGYWVNIPGATSATYSFTASFSDSGKWFRAVVTDVNGVTTSDSGQLHVSKIVPVFITHPQSITKLIGKTATFAATYYGTPPVTQLWEADTGTGWYLLLGETGATYTTGILDTSDTGDKFRMRATNSVMYSYSNAATITVSSFFRRIFGGLGFSRRFGF